MLFIIKSIILGFLKMCFRSFFAQRKCLSVPAKMPTLFWLRLEMHFCGFVGTQKVKIKSIIFLFSLLKYVAEWRAEIITYHNHVLSDAINEFLGHVYIGLTGSVTMITCTVLALTRLVFHYKGESDCFY